MRFSTAAPLLLTASPAVVSAAASLGFALGTKLANGDCKSQSDYETDLDTIESASGSKIVRGYAASDCDAAQSLLPAAADKGFQVILGIWADVEESFSEDLAAIKSVAGEYSNAIYAVTVGSEMLYRGDFDGDDLVEKMRVVKEELGDIKIGTADSWNKYADGTADPVISSGIADILLVNAFGFWQGQDIDNATHTFFDDIMQAFQHIQEVTGSSEDGPELWVGETGWPSDGGTDYQDAIASTDNAAQFFREGVCGMLAWGVNTFFFEAFDEPWKPESIGDSGEASDETHWGAMTAEGEPKYSLQC